jgi:hypothetical protein
MKLYTIYCNKSNTKYCHIYPTIILCKKWKKMDNSKVFEIFIFGISGFLSFSILFVKNEKRNARGFSKWTF